MLRQRLRDLLRSDPARMAVLRRVRALDLPGSRIGAGFVRNAVWDGLHGYPAAIRTDIDVLWFDPDRADAATDRVLGERLSDAMPGPDWSVRNQARMHRRNGDRPYRSVADAMRFWPETATAVAVRLDAADGLRILAPFGLRDLFALRLRPTPAFSGARYPLFAARVRERGWMERWPGLRLAPPRGMGADAADAGPTVAGS